MEEKNDLDSTVVSHAKQTVNTYESRSKLNLINLEIPSAIPISRVPPTDASGVMKEKVSSSVSALIVILYWTVTRCQAEWRRVSSNLTPISHARPHPFPPSKGMRVAPCPFLSSAPAGDISEKEMPNGETRWRVACIIHGATRRSWSMDQPSVPLYLFPVPLSLSLSLHLFSSLSPSLDQSSCDSNPRSISMLTDQQISPRKLPNFSSLRQGKSIPKVVPQTASNVAAGRLHPLPASLSLKQTDAPPTLFLSISSPRQRGSNVSPSRVRENMKKTRCGRRKKQTIIFGLARR